VLIGFFNIAALLTFDLPFIHKGKKISKNQLKDDIVRETG